MAFICFSKQTPTFSTSEPYNSLLNKHLRRYLEHYLHYFGRVGKYNIKIASQGKIKFFTKVPIIHQWSLVSPFVNLATSVLPLLLLIPLSRCAWYHQTRFLLSQREIIYLISWYMSLHKSIFKDESTAWLQS